MRIRGAVTLLLALVALSAQAAEVPTRTQSGTEIQAAAAKVHELEATPLSSRSKQRRTDLFTWFVQSPDVNIKWCAGILLDAPKKDRDLAGELLVQAILSAGAFVIEHPESASDGLLVGRAGLRGALLAYQATLAAEPKRSSQFFNDLVALDAQRKLDDYFAPKMENCK
jgi:hypothetical protein